MASFSWPVNTFGGGGGGGGSGSVGAASKVALASGISTKAVTFSSSFPDTTYSLILSIENLVDANPIFLEIIETIQTTSGFTVLFNAPTDSANYVLNYIAVAAV